MKLFTIGEICGEARAGGYATPAFNILNHLTLRAVVEECVEARAPVIIQTSVATVKFYGVAQLAAMVKAEAEQADIPACLHLDHCTDPQLAKDCVDGGWSSVMVDGSHQPLEQNIEMTAEVARYAHDRGVGVEGELGAIAGVEDHIQVSEQDAHLADVGQSEEFVRRTGIDAFAPAVGTAHGVYRGEPRIDYERFAEIGKVCGKTPLVVHGGTGLSTEAFQSFIRLEAAKINISTAIKQSYMAAAGEYLAHTPGGNPLKLDRHIIDRVRATVREHLEIFGACGRV